MTLAQRLAKDGTQFENIRSYTYPAISREDLNARTTQLGEHDGLCWRMLMPSRI